MKQGPWGLGWKTWRPLNPFLVLAVLAAVLAGCSSSPKAETSTSRPTTTKHTGTAEPTVTEITPTSGSTAGGTTVTITGTGFTGATKVDFGTVPADSFTVVSGTEITALSPPQIASMQTIYVTTAGGISQAKAGVGPFYYDAPVPTITGITPTSGSTAGGTTVTISGTGFTGAGKVFFGRVAASSFNVVSDTEITAVTPPQAAGKPTIFVTTAGGTNVVVPTIDQFDYEAPAPTVTGITPTSGPIAGGTTVTITGTGFTGVTKVAFGSVPATSFNVVSDTEITAVSPPQSADTRYIVVTTILSTKNPLTASDEFTYKKSPPTKK